MPVCFCSFYLGLIFFCFVFFLCAMARYIDTANALEQETQLGLRRFEVCDNVDLETILMDYESYYFIKFQKYPKIIKKAPDTGTWLFSRNKTLSHL